MDGRTKLVNSTEELILATRNKDVNEIIVTSDLDDIPSLRLVPGQSLRSSSGQRPVLSFPDNTDGLQVASNNAVSDLVLAAAPERRAIWNDRTVEDLGSISLHSLQTVGRVEILAADKVRSGHVEVYGLDIVAADARGEQQRPHAYGVYVLQGGFTLWNTHTDEDVVLTTDLVNLSVGRFGSPVRGSGVFIGGAGGKGGRVIVKRLETEAIYVDGRIPQGTVDQIAGGVFVLQGAEVDRVSNSGPVMTYGANDMALDNWGVVDRWIAREKVTTLGASGIGVVNFGLIRDLRIEAPIETFGPGARGFNVYGGTVERAEFDRIVTHGDGAVGVQISQPIASMTVQRGIETFGGEGPSLVRGVVQNLSAIALSIQPGGSAQRIKIGGGLKTHGKNVYPLEQHGAVEHLVIDGGCRAEDSLVPCPCR